jgi:signal peptide peptidase SppA
MTTTLHRIAERIINRPLLIHPSKVPFIMDTLQGRLPIETVEPLPDAQKLPAAITGPSASRFYGSAFEQDPSGRGRALPYRRTPDGTAIIQVLGSLVNRGAWLGSYSGMTSYEGLRFQLDQAALDDRVKNVILDIESPGGEATGVNDASGAVAALAKVKPVTAVVNAMAASAAYALASQATRIVTSDTGIAGSIGVVLVHADWSEALKQEGVAITLVYAGDHKVDGNPFGPLPDSVKEDLQAEVDEYYKMFTQLVAKGRAGMNVEGVRRTQARTYVGKAAVEAGLADAVGTFDQVLVDATREARRTTSSARRSSMSTNIVYRAGDIDAETNVVTAVAHQEAVAAAEARGREAGTAEGTAQGRAEANERMAAILAHEDVKGREGAALALAIASPDMSADAVASFVKTHAGAAVPPVEQRSQGAEVGAGPEADNRQPAASSWKKITGKVNERRGFAH